MRFLLSRVPAVLLTAAFLWGQPNDGATDSSPFSSIPELTAELSRITGLRALKKVRYDNMSREALRKYLDKRVEEELKPEDLRIQEIALKKFGLVPQDFKLASSMVDIMAEQAEAFYDYKQKKLFLVDADPTSPIEKAALIHELAHALADQYFELEKFIRRGKNDDSALARMAVMEGQATWIMYEWMASGAGQSLRKNPALAAMVGSRSGAMASQYPILSAAPLYMRASLLFPYSEGLRFQQAVIEKLGNEGFTEVFKHPPVDSQQIIHPEKYFDRVMPAEVKVPRLANENQFKELLEASVGEFDHAVLFEQYIDRETADTLSPKWRGGAVRLLEHKKDKHVVMGYASQWKTPDDAREAFAAYKNVLKGKWKSFSNVRETDGLIEGIGDDGRFELRLDGARITSVEGMHDGDKVEPQL